MPLLTIIVPVYNEEKTIKRVMRRIAEVHPNAQIIYVNDGSSDNSLPIMKQIARPEDVIITKENEGKGSAVRLGIEQARGKFTTIQDADLEYDCSEIHALCQEAEKHPGSIVFGSRFKKKNPNLYKRYLIGNKVLTGAINILFGGKLTDSYTCYKLFPTQIIKSLPLRAHGFELEAELCTMPLKRSISIRELPISYAPRSLAEGKKIRFLDALKGIWTMLRVRLLG